MNIILTHDTRYGPVCLPFDLVRFLGHSTDQSQQSVLQCIKGLIFGLFRAFIEGSSI